MKKGLVELSDFILSKKEFLELNEEQFDSWQENGTLEQGGHGLTEEGYHLMSFRYRGVIVIERMKDVNAVWFMAIVAAWLTDNNEDRDKYNLDDPEIEIIKLDEKLIDIELTLDFVDEMYLSEAEDGPIECIGRSWTIDGFVPDVAETVDVQEGELK